MSATTYVTGFRRGLVLTGFGSLAGLVFLFLETIIAARLLSTDAYGRYVLLLATVNLLVMAIDFGCKTAVTQLIASGDRTRQAAVVGTGLAFRCTVIVSASVLVWVFQGLLAIVDPSPTLGEYVGYVPLMVATASLDELLSAMLQGFQAYRPMAAVQIARAVLRTGLTVVLLVGFDAGVAALVYSWSISFALAAAYQYWAMPVRNVWGWRWGLLAEMLRFGFPLQVTRVLWFASARLHVALLGALAGSASVAYFAVAARIPEALQILCDAYFRVYFPTITSLLAAGRRQAADLVFERSLRLVSFGGALVALVAAAFSEEIITLLFSSKYASSAPAFALLMIALHMTVLVNVLGYTLTAAGRPGRSLRVDVVRTAVIVGGDLVLIPILGVVGAAYATVAASYASNPVAAWFVRQTEFTVAVAPYVKQTLILLLCAVLAWWIHPAGPAYEVAVLVLFVALSVWSSTITLDDLVLVAIGRTPRPGAASERPAASLPVASESRGNP
jgi:O-antigen/teichoic acid export membrane protein